MLVDAMPTAIKGRRVNVGDRVSKFVTRLLGPKPAEVKLNSL